MDDLHRRLLHIGFAAGDDLSLVLAGGYAGPTGVADDEWDTYLHPA